jgi:hypothetical protein
MTPINYWKEGLASSAEECGLVMTEEQLSHLAEAMEGGHECYGMAFYSPPPGDRIAAIESEHKRKLDSLQREFDTYRANAEKAVGQALGQYPDVGISIGEYGEVHRYDGRITQIQ